jgi:hypothetical protein
MQHGSFRGAPISDGIMRLSAAQLAVLSTEAERDKSPAQQIS